MVFQVMLVQLIILLWAIIEAREVAAASQPNPDCPTICGNITIPFPFGARSDCCLDDSFRITCNDTHYNPPKAFYKDSNIQVLNISRDGQINISATVARACYNESGAFKDKQLSWLRLSKFRISNTRNIFTAVGCFTLAFISGSRELDYTTGCASLCDSVESVVDNSCSGIGCCQASIPARSRDYTLRFGKLGERPKELNSFNPCSYAFVVEKDIFNFSSLDLKDLRNKTEFPVVLDWSVGTEKCSYAKENSSYACQASNSECLDSMNGPGYLCNCSSGFEGNPYLLHGCQDIDECENPNTCDEGQYCENLPGNYSCECQKGYDRDIGKTSCSKKNEDKGSTSTLLIIALGISISLLVLLVGSSWTCWMLTKRKLAKQRGKFFQQNGGFMLKKRLSKHEGSVETARIFTTEDLKKATNNYEEGRIIGRGGFGIVYKGLLPDNKEVAIKKSKVSDQSQIEQFINEVIILSQINHRNVVKLLGCCLETEVPLLVYEFITNGTLSEHIHEERHASSLSWEMRLKIAAEAAGALAYLHSATSTPIIHRDVKSTNILLDENYTAKVSDFGGSKLVPQDQTQLTTLVQGTFGYLDPEYFHSSQLTEKSDVYSFGVLLAELLTGEEALSFDRPENNRNLATYFVSSMKDDHHLLEILEEGLVKEGKLEQIKEVAMLAQRCLKVRGDERPSMKEVAMELEGMRMIEKHQWTDVDLNNEETENLLNQSVASDAYNGFVGGDSGYSTTAGFDSMRDQMIVQLGLR